MYCVNCGYFSLRLFCKNCKDVLKIPSYIQRKLECGLDVFSFYNYSEIKKLLLCKHKVSGYFIYKALASYSFKNFAKNYQGLKAYSVALDDEINGGYSHTAILNHHLKSENIKPLHNVIYAKNKVKYSGKSLEYRQKHKRGYYLKKVVDKPVILVDDIITTGLSLTQAYKLCMQNDINVLFALTLADARA